MTMQNLLAIDCSSTYLSIALKIGNQVYTYHQDKPRQHKESLIPEVKNLCQQAQIQLADLNAIMVGRGPGSFVGVRLAMSFAQGLAFGLDIPIIPVSSLQLIAQSHIQTHSEITIAIDAHMGDVYLGQYKCQNNIMLPINETAIKIEQLDSHQNKALLTSTLNIPKAQNAFALLGWAKKNDLIMPAHMAQPIYLRGNKNWEKIDQQ